MAAPPPSTPYEGPLLFDDRLGVYTVYISVPRQESVFVKLMVEAYEGIGVTRSIEPFYEPDENDRSGSRGLMVIFAVADFIDATRALIGALIAETGLRLVSPPPEQCEEFGLDLLAELDRA